VVTEAEEAVASEEVAVVSAIEVASAIEAASEAVAVVSAIEVAVEVPEVDSTQTKVSSSHHKIDQ
jgi:hypothetical protein